MCAQHSTNIRNRKECKSLEKNENHKKGGERTAAQSMPICNFWRRCKLHTCVVYFYLLAELSNRFLFRFSFHLVHDLQSACSCSNAFLVISLMAAIHTIRMLYAFKVIRRNGLLRRNKEHDKEWQIFPKRSK